MAILSKEEVKQILDKVIGFSKADGIEANLENVEDFLRSLLDPKGPVSA